MLAWQMPKVITEHELSVIQTLDPTSIPPSWLPVEIFSKILGQRRKSRSAKCVQGALLVTTVPLFVVLAVQITTLNALTLLLGTIEH